MMMGLPAGAQNELEISDEKSHISVASSSSAILRAKANRIKALRELALLDVAAADVELEIAQQASEK